MLSEPREIIVFRANLVQLLQFGCILIFEVVKPALFAEKLVEDALIFRHGHCGGRCQRVGALQPVLSGGRERR